MTADESAFSAASSSSFASGEASITEGDPVGGTGKVQTDIARLVQQGLVDLERRKRSLELEIEKLERRRDRIDAEMKTTFAGASQDLAMRVQGFKEYLVGSLQDLAAAAEQLEMLPPEPAPRTERPGRPHPTAPETSSEPTATVDFAQSRFQRQSNRIQSLLDQYRLRPDYYGPVWQFRRTFEPIHSERISNWFFNQGGRGAVKTLSSRLQNVLVASAAVSILYTLYGDRLRVLMLANTPERLGEWRRGFQDCLGVSRGDFGTGRGITLFESAEPLAQRAERLLAENLLPLILIDESEGKISLSLLQFPLWLAFAPDPANPTADAYEYY
ncbi:DUF3086 domain-containing protein [Leptolyngbya sp. PCC 6406]|uniref:DUF3086 domain-containing protein n=1 Tax=Leptolyngbya sp. PCC 6406 TaxID=1173264 RepID=UPI0002ACE505|nr:DUF3086 domain-containing protein [Leptolyngbya sp. PCC 6406]